MELKSTIIEIQNLLEWLNSKFELIEERISQVDNSLMKIMQSEKHTEKRNKENLTKKLIKCGPPLSTSKYILWVYLR